MREDWPEWARNHFPSTPSKTKEWKPIVKHVALSRNILAVMHTRIEGMWCAYVDVVPGICHSAERQTVLKRGNKLDERVARTLFGFMCDIPYAH